MIRQGDDFGRFLKLFLTSCSAQMLFVLRAALGDEQARRSKERGLVGWLLCGVVELKIFI
jgi:hypothetical protein